MKRFTCLLCLSLLMFLPGCEKQKNTAVDKYIEQLVSGQYEGSELPAFTEADIPALLEYRNETTLVTKFPHNPISSLIGPECKLGMLVLWTIESIRACEIKSEHLIGRFPSQNPILAIRESTELQLVFDDQSHIKAAQAYFDWWYSDNLSEEKMKIDPLENTSYRWH